MNIKELTYNKYHALNNFDKYELIKEAFKDIMDGTKGWYEIQDMGFSEERSKEIFHLFTLLKK